MLHPSQNNLIWIDLEMTGLGDENVILEIAVIITDEKLNITDKFPNSKLGLAINRTKEELKTIEPWSLNQHTKSGLLESLKVTNITIEDAQKETLEFLSMHAEKGRSPLCGNSISHDRRFLRRYMPELDAFFHYRNVDVSSIKEPVSYTHLRAHET